MIERTLVTLIIMLAALLHACAAMAPKQGNYLHVSDTSEKRMADDVVARLTALYPPARTRFDLYQPTSDAFGKRLVEALRAKGYAVAELPRVRPAQSSEGEGSAPPPRQPGTSLSYLLDQPAPELYLVAMRVGYLQTLQRAYAMAPDGNLRPAGAWTRGQ